MTPAMIIIVTNNSGPIGTAGWVAISVIGSLGLSTLLYLFRSRRRRPAAPTAGPEPLSASERADPR